MKATTKANNASQNNQDWQTQDTWQNTDWQNGQDNHNVNASASQQGSQSNGWSDQDMIGDLLIQEKQLISSYSTNLCEGSVEPLRQMFSQHLMDTAGDQFGVFQQMQQRGWYETQPMQQKDLKMTSQRETQNKNMMF